MKYFVMHLSLFLGAASLSLAASRAVACASCGSGGDDVMVLYPNEEQKLYAGFARQGGFRNIDTDGEDRTAGGPERRETMALAYGRAFSRRSFATLTLPLHRNILGDESASGIGDPVLAGRYTLVMQNLAEPILPQVQLIFGYKHAQATSIHDTEEPKTLLDVFGSGFSEARGGIDVWFGQSMVKPGIAVNANYPLAKRYADKTLQPGYGTRATASLALSAPAPWRLKSALGVNRESRAELQIDGKLQSDSASVNHSGFATVDIGLDPEGSLRVSYSRQAWFGNNRNTASSSTMACAYMRAL